MKSHTALDHVTINRNNVTNLSHSQQTHLLAFVEATHRALLNPAQSHSPTHSREPA